MQLTTLSDSSTTSGTGDRGHLLGSEFALFHCCDKMELQTVARRSILDRTVIYGTKTIPLLKVKSATTITTINAGTIFKSFMLRRYCGAESVSVENGTLWKLIISSAFGKCHRCLRNAIRSGCSLLHARHFRTLTLWGASCRVSPSRWSSEADPCTRPYMRFFRRKSLRGRS